MNNKSLVTIAGIGLLWGLVETVLGYSLKALWPGGATGSVLAGLSFLFISAAYAFDRKISSLVIVLFIAALVKALSVFVLGLPVPYEAVVNPVLAFATQVAFFFALVNVMEHAHISDLKKMMITGMAASILAVLIFPMIQKLCGFPACIKRGTNIPMAYYNAHFAVILASLSSPIGNYLGLCLAQEKTRNTLQESSAHYV